MTTLQKVAACAVLLFAVCYAVYGREPGKEAASSIWIPNGTAATLTLIPRGDSDRNYTFTSKVRTLKKRKMPKSISEAYGLLPEKLRENAIGVVVFRLQEQDGTQSYLLIRSGVSKDLMFSVCPVPLDEHGFTWFNKRQQLDRGQTILVKMDEGAEGALLVDLFRMLRPERVNERFGEEIRIESEI